MGSLVTPVGWAFSIWGLIFTLETIYAIAQLLPALRDADEVKRAGPWFVAACLFQACWSVAFGYEQIYTAQVLILGILQSVAHEKGQPSWLHYLLFSLPLTIHFGWLTAASVVSINLTYVYTAPSAHAALLAIAIGSLVVLLMPALSNPITAASGSDAGYALTVAWALAGVATQLASPMPGAPTADPITSWCPPFVSDALATVTAFLSAGIVAVTATRMLLVLGSMQSTRSKTNLSESLVEAYAKP